LLEAPVPCLLGLKRAGKKLDAGIFTQETVLVLLDTGEVIRYLGNNDKALKVLPRLSDLKGSLYKYYKVFIKEKICLLNNYSITEEMKKAVEDIHNTIESSINNSILKHIYSKDIKQVRDTLNEHIRPLDQNFARLFFETQMFAQYMERRSKVRFK